MDLHNNSTVYNNPQIRIGTSNIVLPVPKKSFPEECKTASRLTYFSSLFNTVELNRPFYKIPRAATFKKWCGEVPHNFEFTVKLWRGITHAASWKPADIDFFMQAVNEAGSKKGCLLMQFPASIKLTHYNQVEKILEKISRPDSDRHWRIAVEFRDKSWYISSIYQMLDHYHAAVVLHDMPASATACPNENASFVYLRFHGEKGDYKGDYSLQMLEHTARQIADWKMQGKKVYAYFNNTIGNAFENALSLQQLCDAAVER
ncbi:MAG: DUF72 domain-containing protein [Chitinophagaceae bacterium]|nr:DUF72 domain-containing protein [Chitinophagaceae bacterium]